MNIQESIQLQDKLDEKLESYFKSSSSFMSTQSDRKCIIVVDNKRDLFFKIRKLLKSHKKDIFVLRASNIEECQKIIQENKDHVKGILFEFEPSIDIEKHINQTINIKVPMIMIMSEIKNRLKPNEIPGLEQILAT